MRPMLRENKVANVIPTRRMRVLVDRRKINQCFMVPAELWILPQDIFACPIGHKFVNNNRTRPVAIPICVQTVLSFSSFKRESISETVRLREEALQNLRGIE
jgi:hypothetical protein